MVQRLWDATVSFPARRGDAARLPCRVHCANSARLSATARWSRALAVPAALHPGSAIEGLEFVRRAEATGVRRGSNLRALLRVSPLHAHLGCDRAGVAHVLVVIDLISKLEIVEVAGQQRVAVEVEQAALFREQESEIFLGRDLRDLAQRLVFGVVIPSLGAAVTLLFEVEQ